MDKILIENWLGLNLPEKVKETIRLEELKEEIEKVKERKGRNEKTEKLNNGYDFTKEENLNKLYRIYFLYKELGLKGLEKNVRVKNTGEFGIALLGNEAELYIPHFLSDLYSLDKTNSLIHSGETKRQLEMFKHLLDRLYRMAVFQVAFEEKGAELPSLAEIEIGFEELGNLLYESVRELNPFIAKKIKNVFGEFIPFKIELPLLLFIETNKNNAKILEPAPMMIFPRIIPYPFIGDNRRMIWNKKQAKEIFEWLVMTLSMTFEDFWNTLKRKPLYFQQFTNLNSPEFIADLMRSSYKFPLLFQQGLYLAYTDLLYHTPLRIVEKLEQTLKSKKKTKDKLSKQRKLKL